MQPPTSRQGLDKRPVCAVDELLPERDIYIFFFFSLIIIIIIIKQGIPSTFFRAEAHPPPEQVPVQVLSPLRQQRIPRPVHTVVRAPRLEVHGNPLLHEQHHVQPPLPQLVGVLQAFQDVVVVVVVVVHHYHGQRVWWVWVFLFRESILCAGRAFCCCSLLF